MINDIFKRTVNLNKSKKMRNTATWYLSTNTFSSKLRNTKMDSKESITD